mgnify:CR=1 FL=1
MIFGFKTKKDRRIEELEAELKEVCEQNRMLTNGNNFPYSRNVKIVPCCITRTVSASYGSQYVGEKFLFDDMCHGFYKFIHENARLEKYERVKGKLQYEMTVYIGFPKASD